MKEGHVRLRFVLAVFLVLFIVTCQCSSLILHASPASTHGCAPLNTPHATIETGSGTTPFYLPLGSVIAPHGYLVLFPSMFSGTLLSANVRLLIGGVYRPGQHPITSY